jgi:hypothetical protein
MELSSTIEILRNEMVSCGLKAGFTNERTIQISQLLDTHIAQYHVHKFNKKSTAPLVSINIDISIIVENSLRNIY